MRVPGVDSYRCAIEVHSFSLEERREILPRLYKVLAASGCCTVGCRRCGARGAEYSFEVELGGVVELYCGLAQAGLEMTEESHRALTEVCVLRSYQRALRGSRCVTPSVVNVRLTMSFVDAAEELAVAGLIVESA